VSQRVLVLGGGGMLGHKMFEILSRDYETWCTLRVPRDSGRWRTIELFQSDRVLDACDLADRSTLERVLTRVQPDVIVNCVGVIKQRADAQNAIPSIAINALLPHWLVCAAAARGARLIHISSDCVFSGRTGNYHEDDFCDADDLYGRTKALGEVRDGNALTLRTSIIGRELRYHQSLLDWFLRQEGAKTVPGYRRALWSGVTTIHLAQLVGRIIRDHPDLCGLFHVSSGTMSKHDLLQLLKRGYGLDLTVVPDETVVIDRSLDGRKLEAAIGYKSPPWEEMVEQLVTDPTPYARWAPLHALD
jgi:dTDP-4-dehydrorhamnose reductase